MTPEEKQKKVIEILEYFNYGDCKDCAKGGCEECFEGTYWSPSDAYLKRTAKKLIKTIESK